MKEELTCVPWKYVTELGQLGLQILALNEKVDFFKPPPYGKGMAFAKVLEVSASLTFQLSVKF